jgi:protoheme IX farnesyltransferase
MSLVSDSRHDLAAHGAADLNLAAPADFWALLKPRVMSLVVFTALVGIVAAPGHIHPVLGFVALLAIAVGAGASGALNMWYDADIDAQMSRTKERPVPAGRVTAGEAFGFGLFLSVASVLVLGLVANWMAAGWLAFTIVFYVVIYTMWLKRSTVQNIVIGGAAGAFPPIVGWVAVTGSLALEPVLMFLIIFLWTPPHFWALALFKCRDYTLAGVPMLPVVAGERATRRQILWYTLALVPVGLSPVVLGFGGWWTLGVGLLGGAGMLLLAWRIFREADGDYTSARQMFGFSILYLFALFAAMLVENAFLAGA